MGWLGKLFGRTELAKASIIDEPARIVGAAHVLIMDGERVDDARDYIGVVAEIAAITGGALRFDEVTCTESGPPTDDELDEDETLDRDATRVLVVRTGRHVFEGRLRGHTDWIDGERLLALLDRALPDGGPRLFEIHHASWGQELGVVFATAAQLDELRAAGYIIESDAEPEPHEDEVLAADRVMHGHRFGAGTRVEYWSDPPFDEMSVTLASPLELVGLALPVGTAVLFNEKGGIHCCVIPSSGTRKRIPFGGGAWLLDQAEVLEE
jgi:hypothetical protein